MIVKNLDETSELFLTMGLSCFLFDLDRTLYVEALNSITAIESDIDVEKMQLKENPLP